MINLIVLNCNGKKASFEYDSKEELVLAIDSDTVNVPMLDDTVLGIISDEGYSTKGLETVEDLYYSLV